MIEFVTASHKNDVLKNNLLKSDILQHYPLSVVQNYDNIPKAYNSVKTEGITVYTHHDVFLPMFFEEDLLTALENAPAGWGIMGLAGVKFQDNRRQIVGHILDRGKTWGSPIKDFEEVNSLDEMLIVTKGDLVFDEQFAQDFYGADLCMQVRTQGRKCYVFKGFCDHNSSRPFKGPGLRTESFYESRELFRKKWIEYLPIVTTVGIIE